MKLNEVEDKLKPGVMLGLSPLKITRHLFLPAFALVSEIYIELSPMHLVVPTPLPPFRSWGLSTCFALPIPALNRGIYHFLLVSIGGY